MMNDVACDVIKRMHPPSLPSAAQSVAFHEGNFLFPGHGDYLTEGEMLSTFRKERYSVGRRGKPQGCPLIMDT
jgi:hypothetical protein